MTTKCGRHRARPKQELFVPPWTLPDEVFTTNFRLFVKHDSDGDAAAVAAAAAAAARSPFARRVSSRKRTPPPARKEPAGTNPPAAEPAPAVPNGALAELTYPAPRARASAELLPFLPAAGRFDDRAYPAEHALDVAGFRLVARAAGAGAGAGVRRAQAEELAVDHRVESASSGLPAAVPLRDSGHVDRASYKAAERLKLLLSEEAGH